MAARSGAGSAMTPLPLGRRRVRGGEGRRRARGPGTQNFRDNQRWRFVRVNAHHQIRSVNSGKCLTVGVRQAAGSPIVQHNCNPYLLSQAVGRVPGQQLTVTDSRLGDDPRQSFDFTTSVR
jgi:hypothetical protein